MTAQFPEKLVYKGESVGMCATPLDDYFTLMNWQPDFLVNCTGLWRGYVGGWLIEKQRLYLTEIKNAQLLSGEDFTLKTLFPDHHGKVFAHWFCGVIRIPRGELIKYFHGGFASVYERDSSSSRGTPEPANARSGLASSSRFQRPMTFALIPSSRAT